MRLIFPVILMAMLAAPAIAQPAGMIGPSFAPSSVRAENFDTVFEVKVVVAPAVVVLRNQTTEARWDAVVCNPQAPKVTAKGAVRVEQAPRWGFLDPGMCTMFTNFSQLELAPAEGSDPWTAKVYLRSHR